MDTDDWQANCVRIVAALVVLLLTISAHVAAQSVFPVRIVEPVPADTGETGRVEELFRAYLRQRFEALGVKITDSSTNTTVFEVHSSVLPLNNGEYDVAAVLVIFSCTRLSRPQQCGRGPPFDWSQTHNARDLEAVARKLAENYYTENRSFWDLIRSTDSISRANKH